MALPPTKVARDANLDDLKAKVQEWAEIETQRIENEVQFLQAVLNGRGITDESSANLAVLTQAASVLQTEVDSFLTSVEQETLGVGTGSSS